MRPTKSIATALLVAAVLLQTGCLAREAAVESPQRIAPASGGGAPDAVQESMKDGAVSHGTSAYDEANAVSGGSDRYLSTVAPGEPERMIIRNASLEVRVNDVDTAVPKLRALVLSQGGEIAELSMSGGDGVSPLDAGAKGGGATYATVVVRVPATKLDALADALAALGTVVSRNESSSDVTEQAIDMEARLKNLRAEEDRLRSFLDRTNKVSELLAVEAELARVRGEIESMDAQLTYLKRQVAKATLSVSLSEPGSVAGPESPWYRLREAFSQGVQGAIQVVEVLITLVIAALPLVAIIGGFVLVLVTSTRRRRRRRTADASTPVDEDVEE